MTGPLAIGLAAVMGLTALHCAGRLAAAPMLGRTSDRRADLLHVVMGSVMAASLLGVLGRRWDVVWLVGFLAAAFWFVREGVVRSSRHSLQHGVGCLAMVAMVIASSSYAGPAGAARIGASVGMVGMPGMGSPTTTGAFAPSVVLVGLLAFGVLALTAADAVQVGRAGVGVAAVEGRPLAPRCAAACRVTMGVGMGLALVAML
jgi:hypothetical protein